MPEPAAVVRVSLPPHARRLAGLSQPMVEVPWPGGTIPTVGALLAALEQRYPALCGTLRDHPPPAGTGTLRPFIRVFAGSDDLTRAGLEAPVPAEVVEGREVLRIIGAIAGG